MWKVVVTENVMHIAHMLLLCNMRNIGHSFVWDLEVLLCPFPLGNCKSCPVECNNSSIAVMILNRIIHQPLLNTSEAFSSPWTADNYNFLYLTLGGYACPICNRPIVDMTRAWWMLDNEISMTSMPEKENKFYVKVDLVTVCCLFCFSYFFFL